MLGSTLANEIKNYPDGLLIKTDENAKHGAVVTLMDKARYAGVKAISVDRS